MHKCTDHVKNNQIFKRSWRVSIVCVIFGVARGFAFQQPIVSTPRWGGLAQVTLSKSEENQGFVFGLERIRLIASGAVNHCVNYKLQFEFNRSVFHEDKDGETPNVIKDAVLFFSPIKGMRIWAGKFKTPIGMEFNTSGKTLAFVKRGLGQALVFERNLGVMLSTPHLGRRGLGLSAGVFNPGPNGANETGDPAAGQDYTVAGRVHFDPSGQFHLEAFGGAALTSVASQKSVTVLGLGVRWRVLNRILLKAEWMSRDDAQNAGSDGVDGYMQAGVRIHPNIDTTVKWENLNVKDAGMDQKNLTLGLSIALQAERREQSRILLNYVLSDKRGRDAFQLMCQAAF